MFKQGVERYKGNSGKLWAHLKSLGYSKGSDSVSNIVLEEAGAIVNDLLSVSRLFNKVA